ncbi:matrixin family metalloprotease [Nocardia brasiliensis]|uniref:matrixin family metalloprotease n=1 Tax=Nocardia brasiliensis TaxID=37326 RepID=UPI00366BE97D
MPSAVHRRNYRGRHRAAKSPTYGTPRLFATLLAGSLLAPGALSLATTATAAAQAPSFNYRAHVQGYDSDGRAIIHYNNKVNDPDIEKAVEHLNSTPGLELVLKPGTGKGAINISHGPLGGGVVGLGGWDNGPFVKLDPNNRNMERDDRTEVAAHELLHSIGLDHNDSGCSIMASVVNRCNSGPTPLSRNEISQLNSMYQKGKPTDPADETTPTDTDETEPTGDTTQPGDPGDWQDQPDQDGWDDWQSQPGQDPWGDWQSQPDQDSWGDWQSQPGQDPWGDWQSQPDQDPWGDWQSQPDQDPWGDWQSQPDQDPWSDWQSQPEQDSWGDWQSQPGQDPWSDWQSQPEQDSWGDWQSQPEQDSWSDWQSQPEQDTWNSWQRQPKRDSWNSWPSEPAQDTWDGWFKAS